MLDGSEKQRPRRARGEWKVFKSPRLLIPWLRENLAAVSVTLLTVTFIAAVITVTDLHSYQDSASDVWIPNNSIKQYVSREFLSVAIDSGKLASDSMLKILQSQVVIKLAKYLSPGYLRIGGNAADLVVFQENGTKETYLSDENQSFHCSGWDIEESYTSPKLLHQLTMTGKEWLAINNAAQSAGLSLVFDLNVMLRTSGGFWNSSNARQLLRFSKDNGITAIWQLGNEPNSFYHKFGMNISPQQLGNDFNALNRILQHEKFLLKPLLVGPDVTRPMVSSLREDSTTFLKEFLRVAGKSLDAITWHQYYFSGRTAQLNDFLNVTHFDELAKQIREVKEIVAFTVRKKVPIWLSETATAYGGGAPGLSDRFVATFLWLDKLGVCARDGVDVVIKQALVGGNYGLIDWKNSKPLPSWWVSLLYKELVGLEVLRVYAPMAREQFRIYGHRSAKSSKDIVLFGVNFADKATKLKIFYNCTQTVVKEKYILTAPEDDLTSDSILLNGNLLSMSPDGSVPPLPFELEQSDHLTIPPYSLMFIVLKKYGEKC